MAKFPEAQARLFKNVYVCRKCKTKRKATTLQIREKRVACRRCGSKAFRPKKKLTKVK